MLHSRAGAGQGHETTPSANDTEDDHTDRCTAMIGDDTP